MGARSLAELRRLRRAGRVVEVDLDRWASYGQVDHPDRRLVGASYVPPIHERRNRRGALVTPARPVAAAITGPLGGRHDVTDPAVIRAEGLRLLDVAATLAAIQIAFPPRQTHQEELIAP